MTWQGLLAKIGLYEPPLPDLVRDAADRTGMVNRRAFLQLAGAAIAGLAIDPERLIWTPGAQTILIPEAVRRRVGGGGRNSFVTPDWLVREMLHVFEQQLTWLEGLKGRP